MTLPRLRYLTLLMGCVCYYFASGEWLSCFLLLAVGLFPLISLALSMPAIRKFRIAPMAPDTLLQGEEGEAVLMGSCPYPLPPFRGKLLLENCFTGESRRYNPEEGIPTAHCGGIRLSVEKARVCDYLGLFDLRAAGKAVKTLRIRPRPVAPEQPPDLRRFLVSRWKPKPGGGFAENHELRLYRPGDSLNQVHWKLSAKTGNLILREAMEPVREKLLLTLCLRGTPEVLDQKLGELLWVGRCLLEQGLCFEIRCLTGSGVPVFPVNSPAELEKAVDRLLCSPLAAENAHWTPAVGTDWEYHIGGGDDEIH